MKNTIFLAIFLYTFANMSKKEIITAEEAGALIKDGMTIMVGGFMTCGTAKSIVNAVKAHDLTVICNDAGFENEGCGRLLARGQVKRLIASHVGLNKQCGELVNAGKMELKLQPQGTLVEQIRAAGAGLGGVLTPTGVGTIVADSTWPTTMEGKQIIEVDGKEYLLEKPLKGDVAIIKGYVADESGNIRYKGTLRNFNPLMATACKMVIAEVEKIVPTGEIGPDFVETPHIFIDYLVLNPMDEK